MEIGKVSENILKRSVFKQIKHRRNEVLVRPNIGEDCSVVKLNADELFVVSTDPITGATKDIGSLAIHITANDLASSGAEPIGVLLTILLPEGTSEDMLKSLMQEIEKTAAELNIEIMGGHTEVTKAVIQPVVNVMGIGKTNHQMMITTSGAKIGQDIILTKWAGLEGTSIIAKEKEMDLLKRYNRKLINEAKALDQHLSVIKESKIAIQYEATAMHDVTEGGVFGALWELASSAKLGLKVELDKIALKQATIEICEFFDLNPYKLISSGCMLITTHQGHALVNALKEENIEANIIGKICEGNERVVVNEGKQTCLEPPKSDELYKVIS